MQVSPRRVFLLTSIILGIGVIGTGATWWFTTHQAAGATTLASKASPSAAPTPVIPPSPTITAAPRPTLTPTPVPTPTPAASTAPSATVQAAIQKVVDANPKLTIGASYIDLGSGKLSNVNGGTIFTAASTTKVLVGCFLLSQVEAGKHSLNDVVGGVPASTHLQRMINQSSNASWVALMEWLGYDAQKAYADSLGVNSYRYQNNTVNPNDMALLLSKLHTGKLLNPEHTKLLLSYMQHTNDELMIPAAVPAGVTSYHKYGQLDRLLHDIGIIDNGKSPFAVTIYTNDPKGSMTEPQRIAVITSLVREIEKVLGIL